MNFVVRFDARWLQIDEDVVRDRWLDESTRAVLDRSPGADAALAGPLREQLAGLLDLHHRLQPAATYALYPSLDDGVVAIAEVLVAPAEPGLTIDDALAAVRVPDGDLVEPPEVTPLVGGAAPATRMRQRITDSESERRAVSEMVTYLWLVPEETAVLTLSSTFHDPLLAVRWAEALDELARGVRLQPGAP